MGEVYNLNTPHPGVFCFLTYLLLKKNIMKNLLNNMSEEEKNSIREQHKGGINLVIENFNNLLKSKLGDAKPLITEQISTSTDESLLKWFNKISEELKGLQIGSYRVGNDDKPMKGSEHNSYFIDGINNEVSSFVNNQKVSSLYDINNVDLVLDAHTITDDYKSEKVTLYVTLTMSKGFAVDVKSVSYSTNNDSIRLSPSNFSEKIIPKIGKIQLKNPCFEGYTYYGPNTGEVTSLKGVRMVDEKFVKYDNDKNQVRLYKDKDEWTSGSGQIIPRSIETPGVKIQEITWACSNGKLSVNKK